MIRRYQFTFFAILLCLVPLFFKTAPKMWQEEKKYNFNLNLGLPTVCAGDEPAHLLLLNSLVNNFDLDLKNNYAAVHRGSLDAGRTYAGMALDHHTIFAVNGHPLYWGLIYYGWKSPKWGRDSEGHPIPKRMQYVSPDVEGLPEYSLHSMGLSFLLAPLALPFRNTPYIEYVALFGSALALILCLLLFKALASHFTVDQKSIRFSTAAAIFATPAWHYGRALFPETFLLFCTVGTYALALAKQNALGAGILVGIAMQLKPPYLLLGFPLFIFYLINKKFKNLTLLSLGPILSLLLLFWFNDRMFGSPLTFPQRFIVGNVRESIPGIFLDRQHGLLPFAPIVLVAIMGWPKFIRTHFQEALVILGGFLCMLTMSFLWYDWRGGWCYGPRPIVPIIPLICIPLIFISQLQIYKNYFWKGVFFSICTVSFIIGTLGAIYHTNTMNIHPLLPLKWTFNNPITETSRRSNF